MFLDEAPLEEKIVVNLLVGIPNKVEAAFRTTLLSLEDMDQTDLHTDDKTFFA